MRVLIVDDATKKRNELRAQVHAVLGKTAKIEVAANVHEAKTRLEGAAFDLMILDLYLPMRRGEEPRRDGGVALLEHVKQRAAAGVSARPRYVLAVSAFDEVIEAQRRKFQEEAVVLIPYDRGTVDWRAAIRSQVLQVAGALAECKHRTDLCVMTALHKVELEAVLGLPAGWEPLQLEGDATQYYRGKFARDGKSLEVVAAAATEVGMPTASALAMKMIFRFRPRVLAMAGIAAGLQGEFGDILVAYDSWDYGSGKRTAGGESRSEFRPRPNNLPIDPDLKERLATFSLAHAPALRAIRDGWQGLAPTAAPAVFAGPLASGASVVADRGILGEIRALNDKLIGVEMEAYGVFAACRIADAPRPAALVIKSICGFGEVADDDRYQGYAAHTSARYLYEFALAKLAG